MQISTPQYIDIEDKVVGPLTAKQLGWMIALAVAGFIMWTILPKALAIILGLPVALLFVALAFYKPYGQSLPSFVMQGILFMFKPKIYVWKRTTRTDLGTSKAPVKKAAPATTGSDKHLSGETLHELAAVLDSEGQVHDKNIDEWISKHSQIKKK